MNDIEQAAAWLRAATTVAVLSGAGVSKESGIPTFRDALTGYWENYNPEDLASVDGFRRNPRMVWQWYAERRRKLEEVQPNPGHYALGELERHKTVTIITQNIDGLHVEAGSTNVIELHGNLRRYKCINCETPYTVTLDMLTDEVPLCTKCGGWIRPDVVWFGEFLPEEALVAAVEAIEACDVMLVVGTSGLVYPAAGLPAHAKQYGAKLIEVNPDETAITNQMDIYLRGASGAVLPELVAAI